MIIGIDFDNTIACHDESFQKVALDEGFSIKDEKNAKQQLKMSYSEQKSGNLLWTQAQGKVYGKEISSAKLFQGFVDFIEKARSLDHKVFIISHRTIFPTSGEPIDLHKAAFEWLQANYLLSPQRILPENCFFEATLEQKLERIAMENCDIFIDDLVTVLQHEKFPKTTKGILFGRKHQSHEYIESWKDAKRLPKCMDRKIKDCKIAPTTLPSKLHARSFRKLLMLRPDHELFLTPLNGGGNNRSYKITCSEKVLMGKVYFKNPSDHRNRLLHETSFAKYLEFIGLENFPKLIAADDNMGVAAFDWLSGEIFESDSVIDKDYWEQCFDFLCDLQNGRESEEANTLPNASESAFSLREHWGLLQSRHDYWLRRILNEPKSIPESIKIFLLEKVETNYQKLAKEVLANTNFNHTIPREEQILSPSDFGLHNTLLRPSGSLFYYDFEYAGWDDPAKTIADFFAQPKFHAPPELFKVMKNKIIELLPETGIKNFHDRLPLVVRMINLKWCYICLNVFHPLDCKRRKLSLTPKVDLITLYKYLDRLISPFDKPNPV